MQKIAGVGADGEKKSERAAIRQRTVSNNARSEMNNANAPSR